MVVNTCKTVSTVVLTLPANIILIFCYFCLKQRKFKAKSYEKTLINENSLRHKMQFAIFNCEQMKNESIFSLDQNLNAKMWP